MKKLIKTLLREGFIDINKINNDINTEKNKRRELNRYTPEEWRIIDIIENILNKIGLKNNEDYQLDQPQDNYGTKSERFGFLFFINKLDKKFGHHNIDKLLNGTNLKVINPHVGGDVHNYIMRIINT